MQRRLTRYKNKQRSFRQGLLLLGLLFLLVSCEEKIDWELEMENAIRLVVDGKITDEQKAHEVRLSLPVYEMNGEPRPLSGATVVISDGYTDYVLQEDTVEAGLYLTAPDVRGYVDSTYTLYIQAGEYEFHARATMPPVTDIKSPNISQVSEDPPLYEISFYGNDAPSMVRLDLDWSEVPGYDTLADEDNHAIIYGYYFGVLDVDVNEIFSPNHERVYFPPGTYVELTKESLSEGYANYIRGMLSETAWNGGLFDVKPGDPQSNLSAGAMGYFAATAVLKASAVLEP